MEYLYEFELSLNKPSISGNFCFYYLGLFVLQLQLQLLLGHLSQGPLRELIEKI